MKRILSSLIVVMLFLSGCAVQDAELNLSGGNSAILAPEVQDQPNNENQQGSNDAAPTPDSSQNQQPDAENQKPNQNQAPSDEKNPSEEQTPSKEEQTPSDEKEPLEEPEDSAPSADKEQEEEKEEVPEQPKDYSDWLTVCSYNVKVLYYDHVNNANGQPMSKFDAVCEELRKIDADIVGLQELDRFSTRCGAQVDQLQMLAQELGYPYYYYTKTVPSYGEGSEYGHGIMSRYMISNSRSYYFADFPGNIDAGEPRGFSRSEIKIKDETLVFYNCHLAEHSDMQMLNITTMMEKDMKKGNYAVVTGDMNAWPWQLAKGIDDEFCTMLNTVEGEQHTVYQPSADGSVTSIDNIVVTNNLDYYWDDEKKTGIVVTYTPASDHLPIYTKINFK